MIENKTIENYTINGLVWKLLERFFLGCFTIVISIILARILSPEDYSVVGIVTIIYSLADVLVSNGLSVALIRKKDIDRDDIYTAFIANVIISVFLYLILYILAPFIANIYKQNSVTHLIRVFGILLIINSIKSIISSYISNRMEFKKFFFATIIGTIISGIISIILAIEGFGPWAIVAQQMINSIIDTIVLYAISKVDFSGKLSIEKLLNLFDFSWKIFISEFIDVVYNECNPLIIGIKYNAIDLSYYSKGKLYPYYINALISDSLVTVLFPAMSKLQDDLKKLRDYAKKYMIISSYVLFPLLFGFAAISDNFIIAILTEKWLPASIYIKIFCVSYVFTMLTKGNLQVLKAIGRSDVYLKIDLIKKTIYIILIVFFIVYAKSPEQFALVNIVVSIIASIINAYPTKKYINYGIIEQTKDIMPNIVVSIVLFIIVYLIGKIKIDTFALLFIQILVGIISYLLISILFDMRGYKYLISIIKKDR